MARWRPVPVRDRPPAGGTIASLRADARPA